MTSLSLPSIKIVYLLKTDVFNKDYDLFYSRRENKIDGRRWWWLLITEKTNIVVNWKSICQYRGESEETELTYKGKRIDKECPEQKVWKIVKTTREDLMTVKIKIFMP